MTIRTAFRDGPRLAQNALRKLADTPAIGRTVTAEMTEVDGARYGQMLSIEIHAVGIIRISS